MTYEKFQSGQKKIKEIYGKGWTAHNIYLGDGNYTIENKLCGDEVKLRRIIRNISDITGKSFEKLRILDLALLEGLYGIECALQGAEVIGIDIRQENLDKTRLVIDYLNLTNIHLFKDDVRNISVEKYGQFDVVLCLGIFYHLDKNDLFDFIRRIYEMTTNLALIDTHISYKHKLLFTKDNINYYGSVYREHRDDSSNSDKTKEVWKSIDNVYSAMLTRSSLIKMLNAVGFTSVSEVYVPIEEDKPFNRITMAAIKGTKCEILSTPLINTCEENVYKEHTLNFILSYLKIRLFNDTRYYLGMYIPKPLKRFIKRLLNLC
ncbi:MAG: hypothetical protein HW421_4012 [Ignavibacteria bacterium]|nr:hypothetical protein [Ignavibacteria bacterium]